MATNRVGAGSGLFLQGDGSLHFSPGAGAVETIADTIADETGGPGGPLGLGNGRSSRTALEHLILNAASVDSGAKRNVLKKSRFECPFLARRSRLGMAS